MTSYLTSEYLFVVQKVNVLEYTNEEYEVQSNDCHLACGLQYKNVDFIYICSIMQPDNITVCTCVLFYSFGKDVSC